MQSFEVQSTRPEPIVEAALRQAGRKRSAHLVILTGSVTQHVPAIAARLAREAPLGTWLLVCAAGALSQRGEIEGESGAVGMELPTSTRVILTRKPDTQFGERLVATLLERPGAAACVFLATPFGDDEWLVAARAGLKGSARHLFGGGSLPGVPVCRVEQGEVATGGAAAVILGSSNMSQLCSSSACRLLSPVGVVTRSRGPVIHEIDGLPALHRLGQSTEGLEEQSLVLLALAGADRPLDPSGRTLALRPIQGVDPARGSLLFGEDIPEGTPVAFAVRDAHGARADFEAQLRTLRSRSAGAAPGFGIYISCAGRGRSLYNTADVDTRMIKGQFPQMPFVGMHSTFEIAPLEGRFTSQVYAGVLGVFSLPS